MTENEARGFIGLTEEERRRLVHVLHYESEAERLLEEQMRKAGFPVELSLHQKRRRAAYAIVLGQLEGGERAVIEGSSP